MNKIKVGILGTGKVGSDLLDKVIKSKLLDCVIFAGKRKDSPGIARAKKLGVKTSVHSIKGIIKNFQFQNNDCQIVFDATTAKAHIKHAPVLESMGKFTIDLTPSRVGKMCVPEVNLEECLKLKNVNMVSCGAQAMTFTAKQIMISFPKIKYMELVSTISSQSAGLGTRNNIDEYTQATAQALEELAGVPKAKAIFILNPAVPPIEMRNTLLYEIDGEVQRVTKIVNSKGKLPGNLNIITTAAITVAEAYEKNKNI